MGPELWPEPWHAAQPVVVRRCGSCYGGGGGSCGSCGSCHGGRREGARLERHDGVGASSRLFGQARLIEQQVDDARGSALRQAELWVGLHEVACTQCAARRRHVEREGRVECQCKRRLHWAIG